MATVGEQYYGKSSYSEMIHEYEEGTLAEVYKVMAKATKASKTCALGGMYDLALVHDSIMLWKAGLSKPVFTWPYRFIRKYGEEDDDFYFEAGSKCDSGPGMFRFTGKQGDAHEIFKSIRSKMAELKAKEKCATNAARYEEIVTKSSAKESQSPKPMKSFTSSKEEDTKDDRQPRDPTAIYAVVNKQLHPPLRSSPSSQHTSISDKPPKPTSLDLLASSSMSQKATSMSPQVMTLISRFEGSDGKTKEKEAFKSKDKSQEATRTVKKHHYENVDWE